MRDPDWSVLLLLVGVVALVLGYYYAGFVRDYSACAAEQVRLWGK